MSAIRFIGLAAGLSALLGAAAHGQDSPAMVPSSFRVEVGEAVSLALKNATTDAALAWDDARVSWTLIRVAGTQVNSDRAPRADQNGPPGSVRIGTDGAAVVGVDFTPRVITMDAAALRRFAHSRADTEVPESTRGDQRVKLVESAKAVIRAGASEEGQSGNVSGKTGQVAEIRPVFDPSGIGIGSDIPVVVLAGSKIKNARVFATHIGTGEVQEVRSNDSGIASFRLSRAGAWRVEFHHLAAAPKPGAGQAQDCDWVLSSATLTFEAADTQKKEAAPAVKGVQK